MSGEILTLTAYFAERQRTDDRFLAEDMLDLFHDRGVTTSVLVRGIAGFGIGNVALSDRSLSLSEDAPVAVSAVDHPERILALTDAVTAMTGRGVFTLQRSHDLASTPAEHTGAVRLSLHLGRGQAPGYVAVCDLLHNLGFIGVEVFLGVDGIVAGRRRRAKFFSRNTGGPLLIVAVGTAAQAAAAVAKLRRGSPDLRFTVDEIEVCKNRGAKVASPGEVQDANTFQKLTVRTAEDSLRHGQPIHRELITRLKDSDHASGATALRAIFGYLGDERPHGDRFLQMSRRVPVSTVIIDTAENIAASFDIVDELTDRDGLVTCEALPAMLALHDGQSAGSLRLR